MKWRTLREPSVSWLPYFLVARRLHDAHRDQSASSSSATIIGRVVRAARFPISARAAMIVTMPVGAIDMKTCGSLTVRSASRRRRSDRRARRGRRELRRKHEHRRRHALEHAATADIGYDRVSCGYDEGHVTLPSRRRGRPRECAGSSRSGRDCRTSRR